MNKPLCYDLVANRGVLFGTVNRRCWPRPLGFVQINNYGPGPVSVRMNDDGEATFTLPAHWGQVFNAIDLTITSLDFALADDWMEYAKLTLMVGVPQ